MATNTEAAKLRAQRRSAKEAGTPPSAPTTAVAVGVDEPARHLDLLGDPNEPRILAGVPAPYTNAYGGDRDVAEMTGWSLPRGDTDDFAVAECDVFESVLPRGCTTPTSRMRWAKGQHVPIEVYRRWQASQRPAEETAGESAGAEDPAADQQV